MKRQGDRASLAAQIEFLESWIASLFPADDFDVVHGEQRCVRPDQSDLETVVARDEADPAVSGLARALARTLRISRADACIRLRCSLPTPVTTGLSYGDAVLGQFELIACDAISVIIGDDVLRRASQQYLDDLYGQLLNSPEFDKVPLRIETIPRTDQGDDFIDQFLSDEDDGIWRSQELIVLRKKARIMEHWARRIGGQVTLSAPNYAHAREA